MLRPVRFDLIALVVIVPLLGCSRPNNDLLNDATITCNNGQVPVYTNRFTPSEGGSGVATAPDAQNGMTNSPPTEAVPSPGTDSSVTAMTVACGNAQCQPGQVAVSIPPPPPSGGGFSGAPVSGIATPIAVPAQPVDAGAPTIICTSPPPACPAGQSPQYTMKDTWECTDCSIVVTYGSAYGNYRRCVGMPTINCSTGQVPTWSFTGENWQCQPTCDNGDYDQHTIGGGLVCVPC